MRMIKQLRSFWLLWVAPIVLACSSDAAAQTSYQVTDLGREEGENAACAKSVDPAVAALGSGFVSDTAQVNGTTLHYVRGGAGPAIILLHGFPEDWYAYHRIMPQLAKQFTVVAVDLRGIGGSAATAGGYDAANIAEDVGRKFDRRLKPCLV